MKKLVDEDHGHRAKAILEAYPQLVPAFLEIQRRLGMVAAPPLSDQKKVVVPTLDVSTSAVSSSPSAYQQHLLQQVVTAKYALEFTKISADFLKNIVYQSGHANVR